MFNNTLTNIEKKAILITLAHLSNSSKITSYSKLYNKKLHNKISISNPNINLSIEFNVNTHIECTDILVQLLKHVFEEYNFVCGDIRSEMDILNSFALLTNGIIRKIKEASTCTISILGDTNNIIDKLQEKSDIYTLLLLLNNKFTEKEKTCMVIVRHLLDNLISGFVFTDGIELLDFINGTRLISKILRLNAALYNEQTYFEFYQQSN